MNNFSNHKNMIVTDNNLNIRNLTSAINASYKSELEANVNSITQHKKLHNSNNKSMIQQAYSIKADVFKDELNRLLLAEEDLMKASSGGFDINTNKISIHAPKFSSKLWSILETKAKKITEKIKHQNYLEGAVISALEGTRDNRTISRKNLINNSKTWMVNLSFINLQKVFRSEAPSVVVSIVDAMDWKQANTNERYVLIKKSTYIITKTIVKNINQNLKNSRILTKKYGCKYRFVIPIKDYKNLTKELREAARTPNHHQLKKSTS